MKKRIASILLIIVMVTSLIVAPVLALSYAASITLTESGGNTYGTSPWIVLMDNAALVTAGKMSASGLDTQVVDGSTTLPSLITNDKTLFVDTLNPNSNKFLNFSTGNTPVSSMPIIVGNGGYVTTPYNVALEPGGNDFELDFSGFIDTSAGASKYICDHSGEIVIQVSSITSGTISASITDGSGTSTITLTGVPSAYYSIAKLVNSSGTWTLTIGAYTDNVSGVGTVPDTNSDWVWNENNVMSYIGSITLSVGGLVSSNIPGSGFIAASDSGTIGAYYYNHSVTPNINNNLASGAKVGSTGERAIAKDSTGNIYICYTDLAGGPLYVDYSSNDGTTWFNILSTSGTGTTYSDYNLATDSQDNVWFFYMSQDFVNGYRLWLREYASSTSSWGAAVQVDDTSAIEHAGDAMSIDSSDNIFLSYFINTGSKILQTAKYDGSFTYYSVSDATDGYSPSLAVDTTDVVHLTTECNYTGQNGGNNIIAHLMFNGAGWDFIDSAFDFSQGGGIDEYTDNGAQLAIGSDDTLYAVMDMYLYNSARPPGTESYQPSVMVLTKPSGGSWSSTAIATWATSNSFTWSTIALDRHDNISVLSDFTDEILAYNLYLYTKPSGGAWSAGTLLNTDGIQDYRITSMWAMYPKFGALIEVLKYQPNTIINGTVLPDRDGTQDGVIAWGSNPAGTVTTIGAIPVVETLLPTNVEKTTATFNGNLADLGSQTSVSAYFQWKVSTDSTWQTTTPKTMTAVGAFNDPRTGLQDGKTYEYQAVAIFNGIGSPVYGAIVSFVAGSNDTLLMNRVGVFSGYLVASTGMTVTNTTGTITGSPFSLAVGTNTPTVTVAGTFSVHVPDGDIAIVSSGGWTVTGSPVELDSSGSVTVEAGGSGTINVKFVTDMLVVVENYNYYTGYYPSKKPSDVFQMRLYDTDLTTILAASPIQNWGDRPASIYLNAQVAKNLTIGAAYGVQMYGYNAGGISAPTPPYTLTKGDWYGTDLTSLDHLCVAIAGNMAATDNDKSYTTILSNGMTVVDTATGYFVSGVPGIASVRPNLFTTSELKVIFPNTSSQNSWDNATAYTTAIGSNLTSDLAVFAVPFGVSGKDLGAGLIWFVVIMVIGVTVANGAKPLGALLICVPLLWLGTYFKILPVQQLVILCIGFGFFFIRQFIIKTT